MRLIGEAQAQTQETATTTATAVPDGAAQPPSWFGFMPFVLVIVIFYLLVIRPQNKKYKAHQQMLSAIDKGDKVVTSGGIVGKVVKTDAEDDVLHVEIAEKTVIRVKRSFIAERVEEKDKKAA
jgi:preprotein translocase subunit YajC